MKQLKLSEDLAQNFHRFHRFANPFPKIETLKLGRIPELEGLRAILCWIVVIFHYCQLSGFTEAANLSILLAWTNWGDHAVDVFIILSGFVIFLLLDSTSKKPYGQFILERSFRIYPAYLTALVIGIVLLPIEKAMISGSWQDPKVTKLGLQVVQSAYDYFIFHLVSHITLLQGTIPDEILPHSSVIFVGPAWSLSLEWQFYLAAPLIFFLLQRLPSLAASILLLMGLNVVRKAFTSYSFGFGAFLPLKMEFFTIGIISYYFYRYCKIKDSQALKLVCIFSMLSLPTLVILSSLPLNLIAHRAFSLLLWVIPFSAILAEAVHLRFKPFALVRYVFNLPILQKLGKISYSTYLLHIPIIWILMWLVTAFSPQIDKGFLLAIILVLGVPATTGISLLSYNCIEKPFIRIGKQVSAKLASPS